jgi:hypothetical protein
MVLLAWGIRIGVTFAGFPPEDDAGVGLGATGAGSGFAGLAVGAADAWEVAIAANSPPICTVCRG